MPARSRMDEITAGLTAPQVEAVTFGDGPLLVVAGAGSGKTRVITRRIACLMERKVPPDRIVAVTFTNKAADEMRRRVEALVGQAVYVTTFHSFCARFLRKEAGRIGREPSFTIYDRADSLRTIRRLLKEMELDEKVFGAADMMDFISVRKDRVISPLMAEEKAFGYEEQTRAHLYRRYEEVLAGCNALDFDDLLLKTLDVLGNCPDVLDRYQRKYMHVLVDEYQDTNLPQHLIARALQGRYHNITAVGDPDQMIYTWRGARLENLLDFEEDFPGTHIVLLERNYRSTANILRVAGGCIAHNTLRHEKTLWTEEGPGEPVVVREFENSYDEGRWVAGQVSDLISEGTQPREIAVFYRTKYQSLPLEVAFAKLSLPHQVVDSVGFFDRSQVKDLRAYLQLLINPRDDVSCLRTINTPPRGIGDRTVERLQQEATRRRVSLMEMVRTAEEVGDLSARAKAAVARFWHLYQRLGELDRSNVRDLLRKLLEMTQYVEGHAAADQEDAQEVVDMFLGYARQYDETSPDGGLMGFLEQAALVSDVDGWNAQASAVPFMTLHSAKGLEFDAVFIVGLEEELLPHRRALEDDLHGSDVAALEEERRLFYVGMTRARKRLAISYALRRMSQGREMESGPSRFLAELPADGVRREAIQPAGVFSGSRFSREMETVLKRKQPALRITEPGARLGKGTRVSHDTYGEGEIIEVNPMGSRHLVRVKFARARLDGAGAQPGGHRAGLSGAHRPRLALAARSSDVVRCSLFVAREYRPLL